MRGVIVVRSVEICRRSGAAGLRAVDVMRLIADRGLCGAGAVRRPRDALIREQAEKITALGSLLADLR
jgi:hypothetical protein